MLGNTAHHCRLRGVVVAVLLALTWTLLAGAPTSARETSGLGPAEDYARYQPQENCRPKAKPGTKNLAAWLVGTRGGGQGPISRPCSSGGVSEHKEGRALDWTLDAGKRRHRVKARRLLNTLFATNRHGETDARARRMGVMYIIWDDHIYSSYNGFRKRDYKSSGCKRLRRCSKTLRHRDHMHISLSRQGGRGDTSWYRSGAARRARR